MSGLGLSTWMESGTFVQAMPRRVLAPPPRLEAYELDLGDRRLVLFEWDADAAPQREPIVPLSTAERNILGELLEGKSSREIATARGRSVRTIANQISSVFRKFGVGSRAELAAFLAGGQANGAAN